MAIAAMPGLHDSAPRGRIAGGQAVCTALAAGGLSLLAITVGPALGTFATGLISSLPTVSGAAAVIEHAAGGHRAVEQFMRGFVVGLFGKIAFFRGFRAARATDRGDMRARDGLRGCVCGHRIGGPRSPSREALLDRARARWRSGPPMNAPFHSIPFGPQRFARLGRSMDNIAISSSERDGM
ncbi:MAG: hypothetical protein ABI552_18490 [Casimicrobiaceae bacterium]